jgi:crossover junction endodeoxyribonuclease RusA
LDVVNNPAAAARADIGAGSAIIELPWTAPPLTLNQRRATRGAMFARAAKIADVRQEVYARATAARLPRGLDHVTVTLHYRPRDNRRRDTDNLVDTAKPAYDALTDGRPARLSRPKDPKKKPRLIPAQLGCGLVPDDTPEFMAKPEPIIHRAEKGKGGAMWLEITWDAQPSGSVPVEPAPVPDPVVVPVDQDHPVRTACSAPKRASENRQRRPAQRAALHAVPAVAISSPDIAVSATPMPISSPASATSSSHCSVCGTDIVQPATGRPRKTCSGACRVRASRATAGKKVSATHG